MACMDCDLWAAKLVGAQALLSVATTDRDQKLIASEKAETDATEAGHAEQTALIHWQDAPDKEKDYYKQKYDEALSVRDTANYLYGEALAAYRRAADEYTAIRSQVDDLEFMLNAHQCPTP